MFICLIFPTIQHGYRQVHRFPLTRDQSASEGKFSWRHQRNPNTHPERRIEQQTCSRRLDVCDGLILHMYSGSLAGESGASATLSLYWAVVGTVLGVQVEVTVYTFIPT